MNEKLEKLEKVLEEVIASPHSDFYRKKYERAGFDRRSGEIPLLNKKEILSVPIGERTFVPPGLVTYYSISSGTTDSINPLIVPHSGYNEPKMSRLCSEDIGIEKLLFLFPPLAPGLARLFHPMRKLGKVLIPGNVNNMELTAKIAKEVEIDAVFTTPTILSFFIKHLKEVGFDFQSMKLISLRGELCSNQRFELFGKEFPNAEVEIRYGCSEIGNIIGYRCAHLLDSPPNIYHISSDCLIETIDDEIIYSDLSTGKAFPLIRYQTGDVGKISDSNCPCGNNFILEMGGRIGHDMLKFHGVMLYTESIEESLVEAVELMEPGRFRVHVSEEGGKPRLTIEIGIREEVEPDDFIKGVITESIMKRLYLSSKKTLKDLVDEGIFLPLELTMRKDWPYDLKSRNIISHI